MERWERALNGRFRHGDKVAYSTYVSSYANVGIGYEIQCTGIITEIEGDQVYIKRDRGGSTDVKSAREIRKV